MGFEMHVMLEGNMVEAALKRWSASVAIAIASVVFLAASSAVAQIQSQAATAFGSSKDRCSITIYIGLREDTGFKCPGCVDLENRLSGVDKRCLTINEVNCWSSSAPVNCPGRGVASLPSCDVGGMRTGAAACEAAIRSLVEGPNPPCNCKPDRCACMPEGGTKKPKCVPHSELKAAGSTDAFIEALPRCDGCAQRSCATPSPTPTSTPTATSSPTPTSTPTVQPVKYCYPSSAPGGGLGCYGAERLPGVDVSGLPTCSDIKPCPTKTPSPTPDVEPSPVETVASEPPAPQPSPVDTVISSTATALIELPRP